MSTRSFTGEVDAEGQFKGRYVHSDGYPSHMGATLAALVEREGVKGVLQRVTRDYYGWSTLSETTPDIKGVRADSSAEWGSPGRQAALFRGKYAIYGDGRFENVPGWGIAYTTKQDQSSAEDWIEGGINFDTGEVFGLESTWGEWGYVFDVEEGVLHVIRVIVPEGENRTSGTVLASIPVADLSQTNWGSIECGENFEHCSHYARFHDDNAGQYVSMRQWLGLEPMEPNAAVAVVVDGERFTLTGGGSVYSIGAARLATNPTRLVGTPTSANDWVASAKAENGEYVGVVTKREDGSIPEGVEFVYPPTKAEFEANA